MSFTITPALKDRLVKGFGLPADANDAAANALISEKLMSEELTMKEIKTLSAPAGGSATDKVRDLVASEVKAQIAPVMTAVSDLTSFIKGLGKGGDGGSTVPAGTPAGAGSLETKALGTGAGALDGSKATGSPLTALIGGAGSSDADANHIRVKAVVEMFDDTRTAAIYGKHSANPLLRKGLADQQVWTGEVGKELSRPLDMPTERKKAIAGAWLKRMVHDACGGRDVPASCRYTELDRKLIEYAVHECKFVGPVGYDEKADNARFYCDGNKLTDLQQKALLDDSTSGGLEAVPIEFDDIAILTPLLSGELFPLVTVRNVSRRRIEGFSVANPTIGWGVAEGTDIPLFNTDNFIAAFDTTIFPVTGGIESGLDFEADAPVDIGNIILNRYGEVFAKEMDRVVALGNGTTQPQGVFNASGTGTVTADNTTTGPPTVSDYEGLMFGVSKEYRSPSERLRQVFIGNEVSYRRARGVKVGTTDQRRVFGMDEESYMLLDHPYKIIQSLTNNQVGFVNMRYYRMYRRTGYSVRVVTEDKELARQNKRLIIIRARMGGQLELGGAAAFCTAMMN